MSIKLSNIAKYPTEPSPISLSKDSNYIVLRPAASPDNDRLININIEIVIPETIPEQVAFVFQSASGDTYQIKGVNDKTKLTSNSFFINEDAVTTAANFAMCLSQNSFMKANYNIDLAYKIDVTGVAASNYVSIINKPIFELFKMGDYDTDFFMVETDIPTDIEHDSILGQDAACEIIVNYYENRASTLDNPPEGITRWDITAVGDLMAKTSKSYVGGSTWFDVNGIPSYNVGYNDLSLTNKDWFDCGTSFDFSFSVLKSNAINTTPLYISDSLTIIRGYSKGAAITDLTDYIYTPLMTGKIKPLTRFDTVTHAAGQVHYFNFAANLKEISQTSDIALRYTLYTNSGKLIATVDANSSTSYTFATVNSVCMNIDGIIEDYPTCSKIEVVLLIDETVKSKPLTFNLLVPCYNTTRAFVFINSMGGWDSITLGDSLTSETKITATTYNANNTPYLDSNNGLLRTFRTQSEETCTLQSLPLGESDTDMFLEFYSSTAIYEVSSSKRIVPTETTLKQDGNDLTVYEFKYKYA